MTYDDLQSQARSRALTILGGFHPKRDTQVPPGCKTLLLLGPAEPEFWPRYLLSPEQNDGCADPMDRWSARVIGAWAVELGGNALFPFGGPPHLPFFKWATETGRIHKSPIRLLVHDHAGLFVSFRGALALDSRIALPSAPASPCTTCSTLACRTACPVGAFSDEGYDIPACKTFLDTPAGADCMQQGCKARRACPVSQRYPRLAAQSAYHMTTFKG